MPSHPISVIVIIEVVDLDKKEMVWMAKVSIEVHSGTARFTVAIKAQSMRQALRLQRVAMMLPQVALLSQTCS